MDPLDNISAIVEDGFVDAENQVEEEDNETIWDGGNIVFQCILKDDEDLLLKSLTDSHHPYYEQSTSLLNSRNSEGKTPLELASMLGRVNILKLLIKHGADLSCFSSAGYSPIHLSACWGHLGCIEVLLDNGFRLDGVTVNGETVKQLALRYGHKDCVEFLEYTATDHEVQPKKQPIEKKKSQHSKKKK